MGTEARYDAAADFYVALTGDGVDDPASAALLALADVSEGTSVLDVACGHGRVSRAAARRGAAVLGVDLSQRLIESAREAERNRPLGVGYVQGDVSAGAGIDSAAYDVVVCNFGFSDIDDLDGALATVTRALRPAGRLVFSILHPCFPGWGERASSWPPGLGYFAEGKWRAGSEPSALRRHVGANHRTLATYDNGVVRCGLTVEEVAEPAPPQEWTLAEPDRDPVPTFLVVRAGRARPA
jgi:SAM-dependent methyltransferase